MIDSHCPPHHARHQAIFLQDILILY